MVSIEKALYLININIPTLKQETIPLKNSLGTIVAKDVFSPISLPPFDQSAMDGYAIHQGGLTYKVVGEIKAGSSHSIQINKNEATRIFTGAMIPDGTTAIAKQEIVSKSVSKITLLNEIKPGTSIRRKGEEIKKGDLALKKGTLINPAAIGFLSGLGITELPVIKKPKIGILATGNELTQPGEKLVQGKIYDSNSILLKASLESQGFECTCYTINDILKDTSSLIEKILETHDVLLTTGGISVGDYDFVGTALKQLNVKEIFYKVKQKPGKPLFFGMKEDKIIFALPGNPAAVLTSFYMYVLPAIRKLKGLKNIFLEKRTVTIAEDFTKNNERAYLLKGKLSGNLVEIHNKQSSAMLSSFINANCLIYLKEEQTKIKKGDLVDVYLLPY